MRVYIDSECKHCFGFGMVLPKLNPMAEDNELELCSHCHGFGRISQMMGGKGFYSLVASLALSEGWAWRTKSACQVAIEEMYG